MKKIFLLFFFASSVLLAAEERPQPILHQGTIWGPFEYEYADGTHLSNKEIKKQVLLVPENAPLMRKALSWYGIALVCLCGAVGAGVTNLTAGERNMPTTGEVSAISCCGALAAAALSAGIYQSYRSRAIDNYNLYVCGIKVR